jgi:hypothetical protein
MSSRRPSTSDIGDAGQAPRAVVGEAVADGWVPLVVADEGIGGEFVAATVVEDVQLASLRSGLAMTRSRSAANPGSGERTRNTRWLPSTAM